MMIIEMLEILKHEAVKHRKGAAGSIKLNSHMNEVSPEQEIPQAVVDAILVGFINNIAMQRGVDYALYTSDLKGN